MFNLHAQRPSSAAWNHAASRGSRLDSRHSFPGRPGSPWGSPGAGAGDLRSGRGATSSLTPPAGPDSPHLQQCSPRMLPVTRTLLAECRDPARLSTAVVAQSPGSPVPSTPTHSRGGASPQRPGTAIFRAVGKGGRRECLLGLR